MYRNLHRSIRPPLKSRVISYDGSLSGAEDRVRYCDPELAID
jgi:hypothetical protein